MINSQFPESVKQKTIRDTLHFIGIGLHTGRKVSMNIYPAEVNSGIRFVRKDVILGRGVVPAFWHNVADAQLCTTLENEYGVSVNAVEHLMAALRGCNVDNALIEIDGPEVPIMDGSADAFVSMVDAVGLVDQDSTRRAILIHKPVQAYEFDKYAMLLPDNRSSFSMAIYYPETMVGYQKYSINLNPVSFAKDISQARTFGFRGQIEQMRDQGLLRGGSLNNAVVVDNYGLLNEEGLRFDDEFVRHKLLDSIGDLYLAGMPIVGHFNAYKTGHLLNQILLIKLFADTEAWSYVNLDEVKRAQSTNESQYLDPIPKPDNQLTFHNYS